jgi:hypothetical protein
MGHPLAGRISCYTSRMTARPDAAERAPLQPESTRGRRKRRLRNALLALLLGCALVVPALEIGLRFFLFSDSRLARTLGADLRRPEYFADSNSDDDYWKLQYLLLDPSQQGPANVPDPECGWARYSEQQENDVHLLAPDLAGRRPILLYGDSFAACNTSPEDCFQAILERSDLAKRYCLINYGTGGYGVDQMYLLIRRTIDPWKDLDPIVVVSFLVDNDFDRDVLAFRCWPKPRLSIAGDRLVSSGPVIVDPEEYLARNPIRIRSYLGRFLTFRPHALPRSWQKDLRRRFDRQAEKVALGRKILEEIHRELESRGVRHFFLAFQGEGNVAQSATCRWAEDLVDETASALGVPVIRTRPFLLAAADGMPEKTARFFGGSAKLYGHYNDLGNLVAFEALRAGIEGKFDPIDTSSMGAVLRSKLLEGSDRQVASTLFGRDSKVRLRGKTGFVRSSSMPYPPFDAVPKQPYLLLRAGEYGPTEVRVTVDGGSRRLRGKAMSVARPKLTYRPRALILSVRVDGRIVVHERLPFAPRGLDLDVDLSGAKELELVAENTDSDPAVAWIHIEDARLE